ncbi:MAG: hypothetical protein U0894_13060 [Pirellulales bacterium]
MITRRTAILDALQAITDQNFGYDERRHGPTGISDNWPVPVLAASQP